MRVFKKKKIYNRFRRNDIQKLEMFKKKKKMSHKYKTSRNIN